MDISGSSEYGLGLGDSDVENDGDIKSTFVGRLHTMISQVTDDIIGFIDDGSSFQVPNSHRLPQHTPKLVSWQAPTSGRPPRLFDCSTLGARPKAARTGSAA